MNEREKSGAPRGDLIDFLLELKNEEQSKKFRESRDIPILVFLCIIVKDGKPGTKMVVIAKVIV